jgi:hypothetical protein
MEPPQYSGPVPDELRLKIPMSGFADCEKRTGTDSAKTEYFKLESDLEENAPIALTRGHEIGVLPLPVLCPAREDSRNAGGVKESVAVRNIPENRAGIRKDGARLAVQCWNQATEPSFVDEYVGKLCWT